MTRDETLALWQKCEAARAAEIESGSPEDQAHQAARQIWNKWAEALLEKQKALKETGGWQLATVARFRPRIGGNEATRQWLKDARADFTEHSFEADSNFSGYVFPDDADFRRARFRDVTFEDAIFCDVIQCDRTLFAERARFNRAKFSRDAGFGIAVFTERVHFQDATFGGEAGFGSVAFPKGVNFVRSKFHSTAWFEGVSFSDNARFSEAAFLGDALFARAVFVRYAAFDSASFSRKGEFSGIQAQSGFTFSDARFEDVPILIQAHFAEAPRLDDMHIGDVRKSLVGRLGKVFSRPHDHAARFRALKRLAIQGFDSDRVLWFNAEEIRSSRFVTDWPLHWRPSRFSGVYRFWFGAIYELLSDFGRSLLRPTVAWLLVTMAAAVFYLGESPQMATGMNTPQAGFLGIASAYYKIASAVWIGREPCAVEGVKSTAANEAIRLALMNALIVVNAGSENAQHTYRCLYGVEEAGNGALPLVPMRVWTVASVQRVFSVILIFLFGLAIRNMLKLR